MKRALIVAVLIGIPVYPVLFARTQADFGGRWEMEECDAAYARRYSRCTLELEQRGTVVTGRALYGDEYEQWACAVRGRVVDGVLEMKWMGETNSAPRPGWRTSESKYWRGTARLWFRGDALRGEYRREDVAGTGVQYCRGARER